jgi:hypothetical protein
MPAPTWDARHEVEQLAKATSRLLKTPRNFPNLGICGIQKTFYPTFPVAAR